MKKKIILTIDYNINILSWNDQSNFSGSQPFTTDKDSVFDYVYDLLTEHGYEISYDVKGHYKEPEPLYLKDLVSNQEIKSLLMVTKDVFVGDIVKLREKQETKIPTPDGLISVNTNDIKARVEEISDNACQLKLIEGIPEGLPIDSKLLCGKHPNKSWNFILNVVG